MTDWWLIHCWFMDELLEYWSIIWSIIGPEVHYWSIGIGALLVHCMDGIVLKSVDGYKWFEWYSVVTLYWDQSRFKEMVVLHGYIDGYCDLMKSSVIQSVYEILIMNDDSSVSSSFINYCWWSGTGDRAHRGTQLDWWLDLWMMIRWCWPRLFVHFKKKIKW